MVYDPRKSSGLGQENLDASLQALPFLSIIQKGSPEFDTTHRHHATKKMAGATPGSVLFGAERVLVPTPILVIPLAQVPVYTEWKPLPGGGFVGNRPVTVVNDRNYRKGAPGKPNKEFLGPNELVYTIMFAVLFQHEGRWKNAVIAFTATQLKHARAWINQVKAVKYEGDLATVKPPMFSSVYSLSTGPESNDQGSWMGWKIDFSRMLKFDTDAALLEQAEGECRKALEALPGGPEQKALNAGDPGDTEL